jgi:hypothetical protein
MEYCIIFKIQGVGWVEVRNPTASLFPGITDLMMSYDGWNINHTDVDLLSV